jgi:hypothetical protein
MSVVILKIKTKEKEAGAEIILVEQGIDLVIQQK